MSMMLRLCLLLHFLWSCVFLFFSNRMMMTDCVYWLLFWFDTSDNKHYPIAIFSNLDDVFEDVRSRVRHAPYVCRFRLLQFHLGNTMSIYYDDNKIMLE